MLNFDDRISYLENCLIQNHNNYADSFKTDIALFLGDFTSSNPQMNFLNKLSTEDEILAWVNKLTSRIVLKFDEENEQLNDFIFEYMNNN
jgi:hypothetical protein